MTPLEIEEAARNKYNAISDSFWSQDEIMGLIYEACLDMAREAVSIENVYSTPAVSAQQSYAMPTNAISIKRIEFNGAKVERISFREDDSITNLNSSDSGAGNPTYYWEWNRTIYFRPIPNNTNTIRIFTYDMPQAVTSTSTLEIPTQFHRDIVNYVTSEMAAKDQNPSVAALYRNLWEKAVIKAKAWSRKRKRGDEFAVVKNADDHPRSILGTV
jgi:hypothetical protein